MFSRKSNVSPFKGLGKRQITFLAILAFQFIALCPYHTSMRLIKTKVFKTAFALIAILLFSCSSIVEVKIDVVDQRTALENQVLGAYQEIGDDLMMLASVRSIDENGRLVKTPPMSEGRKTSIKSMQRSLFNLDDIESFKADGALGETNKGYLKYFETKNMETNPKQKEFTANLMREENEDRKNLYLRIVEINENFREGDLAKVEAIMAGLNRDSAKPGEMIQLDSGEWIKKAK